ncbi:MAG: GBS Bsp-like repeat-containing protein [Lachnospiraceae bacterium]|nr:GBS Bsp-like repeat-containing protein [Lachnospiraceae bacterium]MBR1853861.1 GBS Bsp-like repeat-containing protein [Lachnospiraceae bacterium]
MEKMCRKAVVYIIVLTLAVGNLSVPMKVEAAESEYIQKIKNLADGYEGYTPKQIGGECVYFLNKLFNEAGLEGFLGNTTLTGPLFDYLAQTGHNCYITDKADLNCTYKWPTGNNVFYINTGEFEPKVGDIVWVRDDDKNGNALNGNTHSSHVVFVYDKFSDGSMYIADCNSGTNNGRVRAGKAKKKYYWRKGSWTWNDGTERSTKIVAYARPNYPDVPYEGISWELPNEKKSISASSAKENILSYAESLLGWNSTTFTNAGRMDIPSGDWSAWFLALCGERVGIGNLFSTKTDVSEFCTDMIRNHGAQGFYYTDSSYITDADKSVLSGAQAVTKSTFTPEPGDIYILHETGSSGISQVGIIKEVQNSAVKVIVGHNGSALEVQSRDGTGNVFYQLNNSKCPIIGYIRPNYASLDGQADNPSKDTTPPTITNVHVDVDNSGYTISCTATDNVGIDRVQFPTWTTQNGQDDLISDYWINERARGTKNGDTYTYRVNISDHNNEYGVYTTHIYAYDAAGNYIFVGANSINVSEPAKINLPDSKSSDSSTTARANVLSYAESLLGWNNASFTEAGRSDIPSGDWSAWFLSLCGERVGIGNLFSTKTDVSEFCTDMIRSHGAQGFYYTDSPYITDADKSVLSGAQAVTKSTFTPQPGDIYILHENGYSGISQVGMIKEAQNGVVKVIVGHNGSALEVQYRDGTANVFYQWNHSKCPIIGYIRPDYASLDVQNYTLYLNPNGGRYANGSTTVVEASPQLISKGFSCNDLSTYIPSREGYEFTGWYTEPAGGVKVYGSDHVACYEGTYWDLEKGYIYPGNLTVYAQWNKLNVLADLSGNVVISGNLKYGDTLTATVTDSNNTGDLRYQWLRGTAEISEANKGTYKLVQEDIGKKISCVVTSTVERGSISSSAAGVVQKADGPAAPNELSSVTTSAKGASDGKITGVKVGMEYATKADFSDAEAVAGTEITGLKAGTYYVRVAETDTVKAGTAVNVVVSEGTSVGLKGDINGDGTVNAKDRMYLARALAGWDGYTVPDVELADFNVDGAVNAKDRMYLARKLAGWEGYE